MNINKIIGFTGIIGILCFVQSSFAACYVNKDFVAQNVIMDMGAVTLLPTTPIGIIKTGTFAIIGKTSYAACDNWGGESEGKILMGNKINKTGALISLEGDIYSTNVTGIGVRLYRNSGSIQKYYPHTVKAGPNSTISLAAGEFKVDIIKTSDQVGTGKLISGLYSTYYFDGNGPTKPILTSTLNTEGIVIVNSTCEIVGDAHKYVDLGTIHRDEIPSVGQTSSSVKTVDLGVKCNGGNQKSQNVKLSFNYTPNVNFGANGVIANTSSSNSGGIAAQGISVQIFDNTSAVKKSIKNGDIIDIGKTIVNQQTSHSLNLGARFFRTQQIVTLGDISATVNFNLVYQ